ncbi:hypothetical protein DIPPA_15982 [Diplonema papillatum]|nr:hypothetical protein DIPPA_15982 [Diplonema papillatum]
MARMAKDIAIIGAGPAGLACGIRLAQLRRQGLFEGTYKVYEALPDLGGRCAVMKDDKHYFDYGFQRFREPTTAPFKSLVDAMVQGKLIRRWGKTQIVHDAATGETETRRADLDDEQYVFVPSTRLLEVYCWNNEHAGRDVTIMTKSAAVVRVQRWERDQWVFQLSPSERWGRADALVLACPPQCVLPAFCGTAEHPLPESALVDAAGTIQHHPIALLLLGWASRGYSPADLVTVKNHPSIASIYDNNTKEGRPADVTSLTVVSTPSVGRTAVDMSEKDLLQLLGTAVRDLPFFADAPPPSFLATHLWYQAYHTCKDQLPTCWDPAAGIGVCGDWTLGENTLEAAWTSGIRLANEMCNIEDLDAYDPPLPHNLMQGAIYSETAADKKPFADLYELNAKGDGKKR